MVFDAYEVVSLPNGQEKRERRADLPSFESGEEVATYLSNNPSVSWRDRTFVKLEWVERTINGNSAH